MNSGNPSGDPLGCFAETVAQGFVNLPLHRELEFEPEEGRRSKVNGLSEWHDMNAMVFPSPAICVLENVF